MLAKQPRMKQLSQLQMLSFPDLLAVVTIHWTGLCCSEVRMDSCTFIPLLEDEQFQKPRGYVSTKQRFLVSGGIYLVFIVLFCSGYFQGPSGILHQREVIQGTIAGLFHQESKIQ